MKPRNFPERKNRRRKVALENLLNRIARLELEGKEVKTELQTELTALEHKVIPSAIHVRTKKNRTAQDKRRNE